MPSDMDNISIDVAKVWQACAKIQMDLSADISEYSISRYILSSLILVHDKGTF